MKTHRQVEVAMVQALSRAPAGWTLAGRCKRMALKTQPSNAQVAPSHNAARVPYAGDQWKHWATSAAPQVCPISREIATTALAPPLRAGAALLMISFIFGD